MHYYVYILTVLLVLSFPLSAKETLFVCTDDDNWFPYVYLEKKHKNEVKGIVVSLTKDIFKQLGYEAKYSAFPWLRCMEKLKNGSVDVVIAGTYTPERASYAHFPSDANKMVDSEYVLARDPFVVITHRDNHFIYRGNDSELPKPLRSQYGYNITNQLKNSGLPVEEYYSNKSALDDLVRSKTGSVLINRMSADNLLDDPKYGKHLHFNSTPVRVTPYFIMFSKKSNKVGLNQREAFYQQIKAWRLQTGAGYIY